MNKKRMILGWIGLVLLPLAASAQIYQDASNSTATVVRDPARQASTEIDAVIYNPAGTAFLNDGWHFSLSGKLAYQGLKLNEFGMLSSNVEYSTSDIIPSLQAAYKKGSLALSFSVSNEGGYGDWKNSENLLHSRLLTNFNNHFFEESRYKELMSPLASSCRQDDQLFSKVMVGGDLYNISVRAGAAYQFTPHLSVYAGARLNYVTEKTIAGVHQYVSTNNGLMSANDYFNAVDRDVKNTMQELKQPYEDLAELCDILGVDASIVQTQIALIDIITEILGDLSNEKAETPTYVPITNERTNGWGITPVIGIDYNTGKFNFAAKYEFETKIHTQGNSMSYHIPSLFSLGASWQIKDNLKISLGGTLCHQKSNRLYGRDQMLDLSDENLIFNLGENTEFKTSFSISDGSLTSGDISASISFSPIEHLLFSIGYTYTTSQMMMGKSVYPQSIPMTTADLHADVISGGLRYDVNDKVQLEFGISKKKTYNTSNIIIDGLSLNEYNGLNMSAGININL